MSRLVAISFENGRIRCVKAEVRGNSLSIIKSETFADDDLEMYLSGERTTSFIVIANFKELHQDTLYLPVVEPKHLPLIVSGEIRKNHPEIGPHSCFYRVIGDSYQEGRMYKKIAVFVYANADLSAVINRFVVANKAVSALYSSTSVLAQLLCSSPDLTDETLIGVADLGRGKSIFVLENRQLSFVREFQSETTGFNGDDVQNINMTVDYCFQALRLKPVKAVLLNSSCDLATPPNKIFLPMAQFAAAPQVSAAPDEIMENAIPLGALLCQGNNDTTTILPAEYDTYFSRRAFFRNGIAAMAILSLLVCLAIAYECFEIMGFNSEIAGIRKDIALQEKVQRNYEQVSGELNQATAMLNYINKGQSSVGAQQTLLTLSEIRIPGVQTTGIGMVGEDEGSILFTVKGKIHSERFVIVQQQFEELVAAVKKIGNIEITSQKLEGKGGGFFIEARRKAA